MRVDFYILQKQTATAMLPFACRLLEKAYQQQNKIYVHCINKQTAEKLDQLLWTYQDISFIPHALVNEHEFTNVPILIGYDDIPNAAEDICINLTLTATETTQQFKRIIEIVPEEDPWLTESRKKYKHYKEMNCEISTHKL